MSSLSINYLIKFCNIYTGTDYIPHVGLEFSFTHVRYNFNSLFMFSFIKFSPNFSMRMQKICPMHFGKPLLF